MTKESSTSLHSAHRKINSRYTTQQDVFGTNIVCLVFLVQTLIMPDPVANLEMFFVLMASFEDIICRAGGINTIDTKGKSLL